MIRSANVHCKHTIHILIILLWTISDKLWTHVTHTRAQHTIKTLYNSIYQWTDEWMRIYRADDRRMTTANEWMNSHTMHICDMHNVWHKTNSLRLILYTTMEIVIQWKKSTSMRRNRKKEFERFHAFGEWKQNNNRMNVRFRLVQRVKKVDRTACVSRNYSHFWIILFFFVSFRLSTVYSLHGFRVIKWTMSIMCAHRFIDAINMLSSSRL